LDYLAARQAGDGHYRYSESSDQTPVWGTRHVLVAVAGKSLPIAPPPREKEKSGVSSAKAAPVPPGVGPGSAAPSVPTEPLESVPPVSGSGGVPSAPPSSGSPGQG